MVEDGGDGGGTEVEGGRAALTLRVLSAGWVGGDGLINIEQPSDSSTKSGNGERGLTFAESFLQKERLGRGSRDQSRAPRK